MQIGKGLIAEARRSEWESVYPQSATPERAQRTDLGARTRTALVTGMTALMVVLSACSDSNPADGPAGTRSRANDVAPGDTGNVYPSTEHPRIDALAETGALVGQFELAA